MEELPRTQGTHIEFMSYPFCWGAEAEQALRLATAQQDFGPVSTSARDL